MYALSLLPLTFACGDEGVGFNITKKVPVIFNVEIPANDPVVLISPPDFIETYRLRDVGAFDDVLSNLDETNGLIVNEISYSITEVDPDEEITIDEIRLNVTSSGAEQRSVLGISGTLQNTPETKATVTSSDINIIAEILLNYQEVDNILVFYLPEAPANDLNFVVTLYYDVTVRARF